MNADEVFFAPAAGPDLLTPVLPYGWSWASKWTWWRPDIIGSGSDLGFVRLIKPLGDVAGTSSLFFLITIIALIYLDGFPAGMLDIHRTCNSSILMTLLCGRLLVT